MKTLNSPDHRNPGEHNEPVETQLYESVETNFLHPDRSLTMLKIFFTTALLAQLANGSEQAKAEEFLLNATKSPDWNAGAFLVSTDNGRGQGYYVLDPSGQVRIYTIHHVIQGAKKVDLHHPVIKDGEPTGAGSYGFSGKDFYCEAKSYAKTTDAGCYLPESETLSSIESLGQRPYWRKRDHLNLKKGMKIGTPRLDTGLWTIGEIEEIGDEYIIVRAELGNLCQGRSGGPAVLFDKSENPIREEGRLISVGEIKGGIGPSYKDKIDPSTQCTEYVAILRPSK